MEKSIWYDLGKQAADSLKSSMITGNKPIRVRHEGKFFGKAPGSTKTAPHHSSMNSASSGSVKIPVSHG